MDTFFTLLKVVKNSEAGSSLGTVGWLDVYLNYLNGSTRSTEKTVSILTVDSGARVALPHIPGSTAALVRSGLIFTHLIAQTLDLALVEVFANAPIRLTILGTETSRSLGRQPTVVGTLERIARTRRCAGRCRVVAGTVQLVVAAIPRPITKPIDLQTLAIAAKGLRRETLCVRPAQLGILVRHVHHVVLLDQPTVDVTVARPIVRDAPIGHRAVKHTFVARMCFICALCMRVRGKMRNVCGWPFDRRLVLQDMVRKQALLTTTDFIRAVRTVGGRITTPEGRYTFAIHHARELRLRTGDWKQGKQRNENEDKR